MPSSKWWRIEIEISTHESSNKLKQSVLRHVEMQAKQEA